MPKTQTHCPSCGQSIIAEIERLFDVGIDKSSKNRLLSGSANIITCPYCGFQGSASVPIVYHDPDKELLLTYFPPELGVSREEQEKEIGPLITRVFNELPKEKRKAYLFSPQTMLTLKGLVEKILEADGITKEMIEAQEKRSSLLQRLLSVSKESRINLIKDEDPLIDQDFFYLFTKILESAAISNDQSAIKQLEEIQEQLLDYSSYGNTLKKDSIEFEEVGKLLQKYGKELSRTNVLDEVIQSKDDSRLRAFVRLARPAMDYMFFQMLSEKIEKARGEGRQRLKEIRDKLLDYTSEEDKVFQLRMDIARKNVDALLKVDNLEEIISSNPAIVDEFFIQELETQIENSRKTGDLEKSGQLSRIIKVVEKLATPPPEILFINELLDISNNGKKLRSRINEKRDLVNQDFIDLIDALIIKTKEALEGELANSTSAEIKEQKELLKRLRLIYQEALEISMEKAKEKGI